VVSDLNPDFWILDPDVHLVCPKMLWMHYVVGISHVAKHSTNWPLIALEMLTNIQKSAIPQWGRK